MVEVFKEWRQDDGEQVGAKRGALPYGPIWTGKDPVRSPLTRSLNAAPSYIDFSTSTKCGDTSLEHLEEVVVVDGVERGTKIYGQHSTRSAPQALMTSRRSLSAPAMVRAPQASAHLVRVEQLGV